MRIFSILILLFFLSCTPPEKNTPVVQTDSTSIFCSYSSSPNGPPGGSTLTLYKDSSYYFYSSMCVGSVMDSGRFTLAHDSLKLFSVMGDKIDTSNHGFGQVMPMTGESYVLTNGRIYFPREDGKYDSSVFWLSEYSEVQPSELLDVHGNGYADLYRGNGQWTQRGEFRNGKLYDGMKYDYDSSGLKVLEIYKGGVKMKDSVIVR